MLPTVLRDTPLHDWIREAIEPHGGSSVQDTLALTFWDAYSIVRSRSLRAPRAPKRRREDLHYDAEFFREHVRDALIPFWERHALDPAYGGFVTQLRRDGSVYDEKKIAAMQARMVYAFACAYELLGEERHKEIAIDGARFLDRALWDNEHGGWFRAVSRDGSVLSDDKRTFDQSYVIVGLCELYRCTRDEGALQAALRGFEVARARAWDEQRGGYGESYGRAWHAQSANKTICSHLDMLLATLSLYRCTRERRFLRHCEEICEAIAAHFMDARHGCLVETCYPDWNYSPRATSDVIWSAHNLKAAWLLVELFDETREERWMKLATELADFCLRHAADEQHGGVFQYLYRNGRRASAEKLWWGQCEAIMVYASLYRRTKRHEYAHAFNATVDFCLRAFYDRANGEWYKSCEADGSVRDDVKGAHAKAAYHTVQACAVAARELRLLSLESMPRVSATAPGTARL